LNRPGNAGGSIPRRIGLGADALSRDTDRDGFTDGEEVLVMRTDPLDARDPAPKEKPKRRGRRRR
jgi:hypothetical protein